MRRSQRRGSGIETLDQAKIVSTARHPRNNCDWPEIGIFAQRGRARPNRIGVTVCAIVAINRLWLSVRGLDAIDGTPVLDIKPYLSGFAPRGTVREPDWAREIMADYWWSPPEDGYFPFRRPKFIPGSSAGTVRL